jgi:hypothetical protein
MSQLYPALQRQGIRFTSLKRIAAGFLTGTFPFLSLGAIDMLTNVWMYVGSVAMIWAAVLQYNIYQVCFPLCFRDRDY